MTVELPSCPPRVVEQVDLALPLLYLGFAVKPEVWDHGPSLCITILGRSPAGSVQSTSMSLHPKYTSLAA